MQHVNTAWWSRNSTTVLRNGSTRQRNSTAQQVSTAQQCHNAATTGESSAGTSLRYVSTGHSIPST
eukprot:525818-Rhodomonas_salina.1